MTAKSDEVKMMTEFMNQLDGLRKDVVRSTEFLSRKLDDQTKETRVEFKELRDDVSDVKERLARGSERMENMKKDIEDRRTTCRGHELQALEKKPQEITTEVSRKKMSWWVVLLIGGALTYVGEKGIQVLIDSLATKPPVTQSSKP